MLIKKCVFFVWFVTTIIMYPNNGYSVFPPQWCNSRWKREARKKTENGEEKKENKKREGGKWKEEKLQFFFFFLISLFKTTEICFGSTKMGITFLPGRSISRREKIRENDFAPSEKIFLLRSCPSSSAPCCPMGLFSKKKKKWTIAVTHRVYLKSLGEKHAICLHKIAIKH